MTSSPYSPENGKIPIATVLFLVTTMLWGSTFIIMKQLSVNIPIFLMQGIRHGISLVPFLFFIPYLKITRNTIFAGILIGCLNFTALSLQTFGLQTTTAGKAGFITGLYIVFVPVFARLILKEKLHFRVIGALIITLLGMMVMMLENSLSSFHITEGDFLVLLCAVFFALQIVFTAKFTNSLESASFTLVQLLTITTLFFSAHFLTSDGIWSGEWLAPELWWSWIYLGIFATSIPFFCQNWGQKYIHPTRSALIFSLEPIFATLFGILLGNEIITWSFFIGTTIMFSGILLAILKPSSVKRETS